MGCGVWSGLHSSLECSALSLHRKGYERFVVVNGSADSRAIAHNGSSCRARVASMVGRERQDAAGSQADLARVFAARLPLE